MHRRFSWLALVVILSAAAVPVRASSPAIQGFVAGLEFCEQARCGAAMFAGLFKGWVDGRFAIGTIAFAVTHETPLPGPNETKLVTGGGWRLQLLSGKILSGIVTGGSLFNKNDGTFDVVAFMETTFGGTGDSTFIGTLSHKTFPPTIWGFIVQ